MRFIRKNERREVRRAVVLECQVVRERDFRLVSKEALDVSPDGMLVRIDDDLEPGERLIVSFRTPIVAFRRAAVPRNEHPGLWFDTEAEVARVVHGRREGDPGKAAGLVFSSLPNVQRFILRNQLRRVPPPIPRRSQRVDWTATVVRSEA
jgi:hypothetical protein